MSLTVILIIILIIIFLGGLPQFGTHNHGWGPSGLIGLILLVIVILLLLGKI